MPRLNRGCSFADSTLLYPVGVSALSALVLLVQTVLHVRAQKRRYAKLAHSGPPSLTISANETRNEDPSQSALARHVKEHGGAAIFAFNAVRAASTLALLGLSIYSAITFLSRHTDAGVQNLEAASYAALCIAYVSLANSSNMQYFETEYGPSYMHRH